MIGTSAAPYGYTLVIWSSGAVLLSTHGTPSVGKVFLFIAGALLAFTLLGLAMRSELAGAERIERRGDRVLAGTLDWIAVGAGVGLVALISSISGWMAWPLGAFAATIVYFTALSLQLGMVALGHPRGD